MKNFFICLIIASGLLTMPGTVAADEDVLVQTGGDTAGWYTRSDIRVVKKNGKTGIADKRGRTIVPCQFDYVSPERLTGNCFVVGRIKEQRKWGNSYYYGLYVPGVGLTIPCEYEHLQVYGFEEGIVEVGMFLSRDEQSQLRNVLPFHNMKFGLMDIMGNEILPMEYYSIESTKYSGTTEDLGFVTTSVINGDVHYKIFDHKGNCFVHTVNLETFSWNEGYALVCMEWKGEDHRWHRKYGLINGDSVKYMPEKYFIRDRETKVSNGLIRVQEEIGDTVKYGFLDTDFNIVIPVIFDQADQFEGRVCRVDLLNDGIEGFEYYYNGILVDVDGKVLYNMAKDGIDHIFQKDFGYYVIEFEDGRRKMVDKSGNVRDYHD